MANWANVNYIITGNEETLNKIMSVMEPECDLTDVLGNFGIIDYHDGIHMGGTVIDFEVVNGLLSINCECAWDESDEWRKVMKKNFSDIDIYYYVEERGNCIYATNDLKGEYFKVRYVLDTYGLDFDYRYFESLTSLKEYLSEAIGLPLDCSLNECNAKLERYVNESAVGEADAHVYKVELRND